MGLLASCLLYIVRHVRHDKKLEHDRFSADAVKVMMQLCGIVLKLKKMAFFSTCAALWTVAVRAVHGD